MINPNKYWTRITLFKRRYHIYNKSWFCVTALYDDTNEYVVAYGFTDKSTEVERSRLIAKHFIYSLEYLDQM